MAHATHIPTASAAALYRPTTLRFAQAHDAKVSTQRGRPYRSGRDDDHSLFNPISHPPQTSITRSASAQRHPEAVNQSKGPASIAPATSSQVPDSLFAERSTIRDEYTEFLDRIEEEQEDIRDAREDLLGSRFRLQVQRRELLTTREKAATQAGATFDRVRRYLIAINVILPDDIDLAILATEQLRNDLGNQEVEYDEAEKAYNMEEWEYTQKESRFIDDMCGATPAPNEANKTAALAEYPDGATRFSLGHQDIENIVAEAEGDIPQDMLDKEEALVDDDQLSEAPSTVAGGIYKTFEGSDGQHSTSTHDLTADTSRSLLFSELKTHRTRFKWAGTRRSIDEWLLYGLKQSRFEKAQFQVWLFEHTDNEEWWNFVDQHWYPESPEGSHHHTDDTTISEAGVSDPVSSNAMRNLFGVPDAHDPAAPPFPELPLLAQDQVFDAFDEETFPTDIEPRDLFDWPSSPLKPRSRRKAGTSRRTTSSRTGSHPDFSTCSTIDEEPLVAPTVNEHLGQRLRGKKSSANTILEHEQEQRRQQPSVASESLSRISESVKAEQRDASRGVAMSLTTDNLPHHLPSDDRNQAANIGSAHPSRKTSTLPQIAEYEKFPIRTTDSKAHVHDLGAFRVEHYIEVQDNEPWNFPLLKLIASSSTPVEPNSKSRTRHRLEALPFVSTSNTPLRLPGPSKYF